jgi:hypothetical protein
VIYDVRVLSSLGYLDGSGYPARAFSRASWAAGLVPWNFFSCGSGAVLCGALGGKFFSLGFAGEQEQLPSAANTKTDPHDLADQMNLLRGKSYWQRYGLSGSTLTAGIRTASSMRKTKAHLVGGCAKANGHCHRRAVNRALVRRRARIVGGGD